MDTKRCSRCLSTKPVGEFHRNRSTPSGYGSYCKPCRLTDSRERYVPRRTGPTKAVLRFEAKKESKRLKTERTDRLLHAAINVDSLRFPFSATLLKDLRATIELPTTSIAAAVGVTERCVRHWEADLRRPWATLLPLVERVLGQMIFEASASSLTTEGSRDPVGS